MNSPVQSVMEQPHPAPLSCQHTSSSLLMAPGPTSALTQQAGKMAQASTRVKVDGHTG